MLHLTNPKFAHCPHCNQIIGKRQRIEKDAFTNELICTKCIVDERFSDSTVAKMPPELREKFRFWNIFVPAVFVFLLLYMIGMTWWEFHGYDFVDIDTMLSGLVMVIIRWIGGIILLLIVRKLPHPGTWMYYYWIAKPENHKMVEDAIQKYVSGEWKPTTKGFVLKEKILTYFKRSKTKGFFIIAIVLNAVMIPLFFIIRFNVTLAVNLISVIAGIIFLSNFVINFLVILLASAFYCDKKPENKKQRQKLEVLSWLYYILMPLLMLLLLFSTLVKIGFGDKLADNVGFGDSPGDGDLFFVGMIIVYIAQCVVMLLLCFSLLKSKLKSELKGTPFSEETPKSTPKQKMILILRKFLIFFLSFLFIALFGVAFEPLLADFGWALGMLSYLLFLLFLGVFFALLKLVPKIPKNRYNYKRPYSTIIKIGIIVIVIDFVPMIATQTWTNPSLESQFVTAFGPDWESKIDPVDEGRMRKYPFSAFDAYFGYEIPANAKYDMIYMQDHPRYVKWRNDTVISNGTKPFINVTHDLIFDAYLPAGDEFDLTFGDNKPDKLPVIIITHGWGMERGSENANFTTQVLANQGYACFDMSYGYTGYNDYPYYGGKESGYDIGDLVRQIGYFTKYLSANQSFFHVNMSEVYFMGLSFGGWVAGVCAYAYNQTHFINDFAPIVVRGAILRYAAWDLISEGKETLEFALGVTGEDPVATYVHGSDDPKAPDYNEEWVYCNIDKLMDNSISPAGTLCPTFILQGTHDFYTNSGWSRRHEGILRANGHTVIAGYYVLGSHGFDFVPQTPFRQSVDYYLQRFLALTH